MPGAVIRPASLRPSHVRVFVPGARPCTAIERTCSPAEFTMSSLPSTLAPPGTSTGIETDELSVLGFGYAGCSLTAVMPAPCSHTWTEALRALSLLLASTAVTAYHNDAE